LKNPTPTIALLPGDGIGVDVIAEGRKVLERVGELFGHRFQFRQALVGWAAIDATGSALPEETVRICRESDAIFFGAVGDPARDGTLPPRERPEPVALLGLRKGLYVNLRPAVLNPVLAEVCPLRPEIVRDGVDILILRELTGGLYYGTPKGREPIENGYRAVDTMVYTTPEIERIARVGFEAARKRKGRLCSVDKANVLACSQLWREVVTALAREYPDVALSHLYVDNCAMQLIRNPCSFDVILTENTFGDILSDEASMLAGSMGMLPSACLGDPGSDVTPFYEPIHGSAPDIAGRGIANPIAAILTAAMLLRFSFEMHAEAAAIEAAVDAALNNGFRTADIAGAGSTPVSTSEMGDQITQRIRRA
jgi:3-isopropylmalate dehydrogenase